MGMFAKAIYDFEGAQAGDLKFNEDDIITVIRKDESGWWTGRTADGKEGDFPFNYVEVLSERDAERYKKSRQGKGGGGNSNTGGGHRKGGTQVSFSGDRVTSARIVGTERRSDGKYVFKLDASTKNGKRTTVKKTLLNFRELDDQLRKIFSNFDAPLPPAWADQMSLSEDAMTKRKRSLENYLYKLAHTEGVDFLLMTWLFPGEKIEVSGGLGQRGRGMSSATTSTAGGRARAETRMKMPIMAKVLYNWEPKDEVELKLTKGQYVAVLEQKTGSPGWWEGQCPEGNRGLFPYNHVQLADPSEARAILNGKSGGGTPKGSMSPMKRLSGKMGKSLDKVKQKMQNNKPRQKKYIPNFSISTLKGFDDLIDRGWCIEGGDGQAAPKAKSATPKNGDQVTINFTGYLWDCQKQSVVEFASSDDPAGDGPMIFTVGSGDTIAAINDAVQLMDKGMKVRMACQPKKGYGDVGAPPAVPPNAHLVYELSLKDFGKPGSRAQQMDQQSVASSKAPSVRPRQGTQASRNNRRQNVNSVNMRPVAQRSRRDVHRTQRDNGRTRVEVSRNNNQPQSPRKQEAPKKKFPIGELRRMVKNKQLESHGIDPSSIEDYLSDRDFREAFGMDRGTFLLKPGWRQKAMKRTAGLF